MSNEKISDLPAASSALSTDLYCIVQGGVTKKLVESQLASLLQTQISSTNIYNTNGTLTGNRSVGLGGFNLTFGSSLTSLIDLHTSGLLQLTSSNDIILSTPTITLNGSTHVAISSDSVTIGSSPTSSNIILGSLRLASSPFSGGGNQFLMVDNSGNVSPTLLPTPANIYNTNGSLTGDRLVDLNGHSLFLGTTGNSILQLDSTGTISAISTVSLNLYSPLVDLATSTSQLNINPVNINFTQSPFMGGGTQYLTVDNSGKLGVDGGFASINIYNSNGNLTSARTLDTNNFPLVFNGTGNITLDTPDTFAGVTGQNSFTIGSNTFQGIANDGDQTLKGKFNVVINDDGGIYTNTFIRFSDALPITTVMAKARGTEAAPDPMQDGDLVGVFAFAAYDGTSFSGLPNFNLTSGMFSFAAPGQAAGNTPGSLLFNVNLSGAGTGTTFMAFNLSGNAESLFGQNLSSTGLNSTVIGKDISSTLADEILIGNTAGTVRLLTPAINLDSPAISLVSAPYSGGGTQYLSVDNTGLIVPVSSLPDTNIYNTDGSLTADRTLDLNGHFLKLGNGGIFGTVFYIDETTPEIDIKCDGGDVNIGNITQNNINLTATALNFSAVSGGTATLSAGDIVLNSSTLSMSAPTVTFTSAPFSGGGTQYLTVDNTGLVVPVSSPASVNIYNSNGSLTSNRTLNASGHNLTFTGIGSDFIISTDSIELGALSSTNLTIRATTFINQSGFIGGGNQYIGVNNSGQLIPLSASSSTNIYNTDGTLTGNRTLDINGHFLRFEKNDGTTLLEIVPGQITAHAANIFLGITGNFISINCQTSLNYFPFNGGGDQYLGVDNSGTFKVMTLPPSTNIYNTDGTLTGDRVVTMGSLGTNSIYFNGGGSFSIGNSITASGVATFAHGINNTISGNRSAILGGQHNNVDGLSSGIFASDQCTIIDYTPSLGFGAIIGSYNTTGFDNITVSIATFNGVNNGIRSLLLGGQTNKINAPNSSVSQDCIIICGNTNTITSEVGDCFIAQSLNCVVGDNTTLLNYSLVLNSSSCTLTQQNYMVDINGSGNNLSAQNAILLNGHNCTLSATPGGALDGRYFMANVNGCDLGTGGGFYASLISCVNTTLNGSYCTAISSDGSQFSNGADHSVILGGNTHNMQGVRCVILGGVGNTVGNKTDSYAIGSSINVIHNNCIMINDGGVSVTSGKDNVVVISGSQGTGIGKGVSTPLQDVMLGRKLNLFSISTGVDVTTNVQEAISYYMDTSGGNKTILLSDSDKIGGVFFFIQKISDLNNLIILPQSGNINLLPSLTIPPGTTFGLIIGSDGSNWFTWPHA